MLKYIQHFAKGAKAVKLKTKQTVLIGLSFASILAFWQFYDQVIPVILENHFGLSTFGTSAVMSIDNILAVFLLPLFGTISDKTNTRLGRRTPYILFGTFASVALMVVLAVLTEHKSFAGFFACLMLLLISMSVYRSPAVAYMPDVTPRQLRSKGNAIINLVGYIGGIFATIAMTVMVKSTLQDDGTVVYESFIPIFMVIAAFMIVCVLIMVFTLNENKIVREAGLELEKPEASAKSGEKLDKSVFKSLIFILLSVFLWFTAYNGVTTSFSRYFENRYGIGAGGSSMYLTVATITAIASFVPLGILSSKIGRKKTILLCVAVMTACYFAIIFLPSTGALMYAVFAIIGVAWAGINVNSFPMAVEMCKSSDVGKYTGYYYAFSMAAQIFTPIFSGFLIDKMNLGYGILFPYACVFSALSFVTMCFVKHGDSKPEEKKSLLEHFDVEE